MSAAGKLASVLDESYAKALLDRVRWRNSSARMAEPS